MEEDHLESTGGFGGLRRRGVRRHCVEGGETASDDTHIRVARLRVMAPGTSANRRQGVDGAQAGYHWLRSPDVLRAI